MAQYDVFANPSPAQREGFPYLVVLQSDQLDHFSTRFVMPVSRASAQAKGPRRLAQTIEVRGEHYFLAAHLCGTVPSQVLKAAVASVRTQAGVIVDALDAVISGV